jgi:Protein of unknown function (DUF4058)
MNPYLQHPGCWEDFHDTFVADIRFEIESIVPEGYTCALRERQRTLGGDDEAMRVYIPDVAVNQNVATSRLTPPVNRPSNLGGVATLDETDHQTLSWMEGLELRENYLDILRLPDMELVTTVEVMSPSNKFGAGWGEFQLKRESLLHSGVHFVEIDLYLGGTGSQAIDGKHQNDYSALTFYAGENRQLKWYSWDIAQPLPRIAIPLRSPDKDILLDIAKVFDATFGRARFDRKIRYSQMPAGLSDRLQDYCKSIVRAL